MDHRLNADDSFFRDFTHPLGEPNPAEVIHNLERALREAARVSLAVSPLVAIARQALTEIARLNADDRLTSISAYVAYKLGISHEQLMSRARDQRSAFVRHVAVYVCRKLTQASFPELGAHFHRDHTSTLHSFNLISQRVNADPAFRRAIEKIETDLSTISVHTTAAA